jgi:hypothetical protein
MRPSILIRGRAFFIPSPSTLPSAGKFSIEQGSVAFRHMLLILKENLRKVYRVSFVFRREKYCISWPSAGRLIGSI